MARSWVRHRELGSRLGISVVLLSYRVLGRRAVSALLWGISLYYVCVYRRVRVASRDYLRRVLRGAVRFRELHRHVRSFAEVSFERILWSTGRGAGLEIEFEEDLDLQELPDEGALFLTAHLGNAAAFDGKVLPEGYRMNIAGYYANSRRAQRAFARHAGDSAPQVVDLREGDATALLRLHDLIRDGQGVTLAADRAGLGRRTIEARFLGARARFPAGPFHLAVLAACPVYFTVALSRGGGRYLLVCRALRDGGEPARGDRAAAVDALAQRYIAEVERCCRLAPFNWFNFYGFWDGKD